MQDRKFICPCYRHEQDIAEMGHCLCHLFVSDDYRLEAVEVSSAPAEETQWPHITLYGAYWCADTIRTRRFLNRHHVPYTLIDIEDDPEASRRVSDWNRGYLSTPTLVIEGRIITEPSNDELAEILGLE